MPEKNGKKVEKKNGARNGNRKATEAERLAVELEKLNTRITQHTEWMRLLSNDLRRIGEKLYGLTEGTVTLSDVKLPIGRYRTPDQSALDSGDIAAAAERMVQVRRRFVGMEKDLAAADDVRMKLDRKAAQRERRKAS
jgi:hypothetical protein